ncbi:MAG: universal stress protein [Amphritea sp.]
MSLPEFKTILYTTSLSDHTRPVFRQAVKLANLYQAKLVMLHVLKPLGESTVIAIQSYLSKNDLKRLQNEATEETKETMKKRLAAFYQDEMAGVDLPEIEQRVVNGLSSYSIVDQANELNADVIVMGSHNKFGRSSATTKKVIKYSKRAVFVVPTEG